MHSNLILCVKTVYFSNFIKKAVKVIGMVEKTNVSEDWEGRFLSGPILQKEIYFTSIYYKVKSYVSIHYIAYWFIFPINLCDF